MSEELQSLVQIIELYGKGLGGLGRALRFSAKGAAKGVQIAQVKRLQHRMKLHYASEGTHNTMKLCDLEKMTGGRYVILNIPIEGEKELIPFYDRLKKMRVSFAELPDLKLGDGYTQIAYNPDDVENVRLVIDYYKKKLRETPKDIDIDEYMAMAGPDGRDYLEELAVKGYEGMMHVEQLERDLSKHFRWRILSIIIQTHNNIPCYFIKSCHQCAMLSKIFRHIQHFYFRIMCKIN